MEYSGPAPKLVYISGLWTARLQHCPAYSQILASGGGYRDARGDNFGTRALSTTRFGSAASDRRPLYIGSRDEACSSCSAQSSGQSRRDSITPATVIRCSARDSQ